MLDLFCGEGGASMGLANAGFEVHGVDIVDQPRYPFKFVKADALSADIRGYDLVWASPPCQAYSRAQKIRGRKHPNYIAAIRAKLVKTKKPYVIENVMGAPLKNPITLCGVMFGLETYRHRLFECSFEIVPPPHQTHFHATAKMGRPAKPHEYMHIVGNFSGVERARKIMQMPWASRDGLREAIPPAYSEYIAMAFLK